MCIENSDICVMWQLFLVTDILHVYKCYNWLNNSSPYNYIKSTLFISDTDKSRKWSHLFHNMTIKHNSLGTHCIVFQHLTSSLMNVNAYWYGSHCYTGSLFKCIYFCVCDMSTESFAMWQTSSCIQSVQCFVWFYSDVEVIIIHSTIRSKRKFGSRLHCITPISILNGFVSCMNSQCNPLWEFHNMVTTSLRHSIMLNNNPQTPTIHHVDPFLIVNNVHI